MIDKERGLAIVEAFRTSQFFEQHYGTTEAETESILNILTERIKDITSRSKMGHCEDCKHFRKFPYHTDTLGRCFQHTGFCPRGDWYCADFEPQESEDKE